MTKKKQQQINFRVSEEEYEQLKEMADQVNLTVPLFCKMQSQNAKIKTSKIDKTGALEIASELRRIGDILQSSCDENKEETQNIKEELKKIWQQLR